MYAFLEWMVQRAALDPDAGSFLLLLSLLVLFGVAAAVIWAVWRAAYIKLWRYFRRKGTRK